MTVAKVFRKNMDRSKYNTRCATERSGKLVIRNSIMVTRKNVLSSRRHGNFRTSSFQPQVLKKFGVQQLNVNNLEYSRQSEGNVLKRNLTLCSGNDRKNVWCKVAADVAVETVEVERSAFDASAKPPFSLADIRRAIPKPYWEKKWGYSILFALRDYAVVAALAVAAFAVNQWYLWPFYWFAQGTMFWALFVVGHDCGHQSFSKFEWLNHLVGHITHTSILVPYHPWRISHRKHHTYHGHVEKDESWYPMKKSQYDDASPTTLAGRLTLPWALFAYPFYLISRSPGKEGSHYDPKCDLYKTDSERRQVRTSNAWLLGWAGILAAASVKLGIGMMLKLYFVPYVMFVVWLDAVTYLHHHGPEDTDPRVAWYRGEEWDYMRGGLSTIDRDYGIFNHIHHDIGTHVVHHLFPQIPHYNLIEATEHVKPVLGEYYREPKPSSSPLPFHLIPCLIKSFRDDKYVDDTGDILYYKK